MKTKWDKIQSDANIEIGLHGPYECKDINLFCDDSDKEHKNEG